MRVSEADLEKRVSSAGDSLRKCSQEKMEKKNGNGRCGTGKGKKINKERLTLNPKDLHPLEGCSDSLPSPRLLLLPERESGV